MSNRKMRIIATMLLLLFLSFQGGRSLFYHTHIFGDRIISHSHPFNNPDRQHSADELVSIAQLSISAMTDDIPTSLVSTPFRLLSSIVESVIKQFPDTDYRRLLPGRAPPEFHTVLS